MNKPQQPEHFLASDDDASWQVTRKGAIKRPRARRNWSKTWGGMIASLRSGARPSGETRAAKPEWLTKLDRKAEGFDLAPDLAEQIGSRRWFRGLGTMVGLGALAFAFWPSFTPVEAATADFSQDTLDEYRSQMIMPLALGGDSGRRMGPGRLVRALPAPPERPQLMLRATYGSGDTLARLFDRAGIGDADALVAEGLIGGAIDTSELEPGTPFDITMGRRTNPNDPRPLDAMRFRARFDLELVLERVGDQLTLEQKRIRVDETPLRITGQVGDSLYRTARAAGAPSSAVQAYLKAMAAHTDVGRMGSSDTFDMIIAHRRAATGERQAGQLLYAAVGSGDEPRVQLLRFGSKGEFYDAAGRGEERGGLMRPVPGSMSSGYGMRRHPVLGYRRMHAGLDFRGGTGTPIRAVTDGRVIGAGRMGGCGIAVKLQHAGNLSTRYCHMSRMAVSRGQRVSRGQVIGYVGSTGLSTGPHLHYEMYRGGRHVDPRSVNFVVRDQLSGGQIAQLRERMARLRSVEPGAALADLEVMPSEVAAPKREIERIDEVREIR